MSIDFVISSDRDAPFHRTAFNYTKADWDGFRDHLLEMYLGIMIFAVVGHLRQLLNFLNGFRLVLMCIFLIVNIRSNLIHILGSPLLVLLL